MIFDVEEDDSIKLKYTEAIVHESKKDIMIPGGAVDLRFQQRTASRLKRRYLEQVENFVDASRLSLGTASFLKTPPSITLPISSNICREPGLKLLHGKDPKAGSDVATDVRDVEYLYTGLEYQQTRVFRYDGWLLLYTSCEGGRVGGARGELRLRPNQNGKVMPEDQFVAFAYKMARLITEGGSADEGMELFPE